MAKVTTIIDIGSNSMRMVVLQKSSRFAYHLINETKARVKISEGSYENAGNIQIEPMLRTFNSLKSFLNISTALKSRKIICVATSALRDAPNAKEFTSKVKKELGLNIKIIDGKKEAYYGGLAALNLLHEENFMTIDIGGGSTEFCIIKNGKIEHTISLNFGTVRLNEMFFNNNDIDGAKEYILEQLLELKNLDIEIPTTIVGIGGTIRSISKLIMRAENYALDVIHGYTYCIAVKKHIFDQIINATNHNTLRTMGIKKDRLDTIVEGTLIFKTILENLKSKKVISSGAGVREGVYLHDLLRSQAFKFPNNFNVSVRSLLDRYSIDDKQSAYLGSNASKIFDVLKPMHNLDDKYKTLLVVASKLHSIGNSLNFYKSNDNAFDFILNGLNYDFLHSSRVVIAFMIKYSKKSLIKEADMYKYKELLPDIQTMQFLSFMISLNLTLNQDLSCPKIEYKLKENKLKIKLEEEIFLVKSEIDKIETPDELKLKLKYANE